MLPELNSVLLILVEIIFGSLAILTQKAALLKGKDVLVHAIAWAVEVFIAAGSFFLLVIFSTADFAIAGFIIGLLIIVAGSLLLPKNGS